MAFLAAIPAMFASVGLGGAATATAGALGSSGLLAAGGTSAITATAAGAVPAMSSFLPSLGTLLNVGGMGLSVMGTLNSANTEAAIMNQNDEMAKRQGEVAKNQEKEKARQISDERRRMVGAQVAAYGGSGVDMAGSPLDVVANSYSAYERDIQTTGYNADVAARTGQAQADIYRWGAQRALSSGWIKAGSTILGGVGKSLLSGDF